jgi:hypothetical protein
LRGPGGANDEFVEIYNASNSAFTVTTADGSSGYSLVASDGVARFTIPNGTVIPGRGHYLGANSVAYSLSGYAAADITYMVDIPDVTGIALFSTSNPANFAVGTRLDAVGPHLEPNTLYKEDVGYIAVTPFSIDYSLYRTYCPNALATTGTDLGCSLGSGGRPKDSNNNGQDFVFVDTNGVFAGPVTHLGGPGPENLASPIDRNATMPVVAVDATVGSSLSPNRVRNLTPDPANNSTFGTLDIRRRVVNQTGAPVTRLRFRIIDITTFPTLANIADLRARTSSAVLVSGVNDVGTCSPNPAPCSITIQGTTVEQPPSQPNGGGFNSSYSAGTITLGTPLAPGASINVRLLLGVQQTGNFKFFLNVEALP